MTAAGAPSPRATWGRKLIHLGVGALPVTWAYNVVDTATVHLLLGVAFGVALGVEAGRRASPTLRARFDTLAGALLKPHEAHAITGATWLAAAMLLAVVVFPEPTARIALWAGAVGDPVAAIVGRAWQGRAGRAPSGKSLIGSTAGACITALGAVWLGQTTLAVAAAVGLAAAVAEWPQRPGDDNLRVTLAAGGAAWLLGVG